MSLGLVIPGGSEKFACPPVVARGSADKAGPALVPENYSVVRQKQSLEQDAIRNYEHYSFKERIRSPKERRENNLWTQRKETGERVQTEVSWATLK